MNQRLVIVGAGGFGRGVHAWVRLSPRWTAEHGITEIAYLDDFEPQVPVSAPIIGNIAAFEPRPTDRVLVAIGAPRTRQRVVGDLAQRGVVFATFVSDSAIVGDRVQLGAGAVVCPGVLISSDVSVGQHAHINLACTVGHDAQIGAFTTLSPSCNLGGGVMVGKGAFLGSAVTVIPRTNVGEHAFLGAGTVVTREIRPMVKAVGNPAREIGVVDS